MVEAGSPPVELDYELNSLGVNRFHDTLTGPFTAHPKYDPAPGELHAMPYHLPGLTHPLPSVGPRAINAARGFTPGDHFATSPKKIAEQSHRRCFEILGPCR